MNSGEPRAGVEQLLKILSLLPDNEENADKVNTQTLYYNLGIGLAYVGEWSTCFSVLENIVNPSLYAKAAMTRGKAAERMRMFDVALDELKKARETAERIGDWSTASKVYFIESKVNQSVKNPKEARENLRQATQMANKIHNPNEKNEHMAMIGEAFIEARCYEEAQRTLAGVKLEDSPKTCFLVGHNMSNLRDYEAAIEMFQKAAKYFFMENNLEMAGLSYLEEGKCYLKLNKLPQALEAFKTALTTFEDINISSIRKAHGLWNANGGIGEALFKQNSKDCLEPLQESILLLEQEKKNIESELRQKRKMLARAKRQFNVPDQSEGESTDQSTLTNVSRISCPRILNTLQGHDSGVLLNRPFLVRTKTTYREQLLKAKPPHTNSEDPEVGMNEPAFIQSMQKPTTMPAVSIMPRQSGYLSSLNGTKTALPAKPKNRGRRINGSGNNGRPRTAEKYGLKQGSGSDSSSCDTPAKILKDYENNLKKMQSQM